MIVIRRVGMAHARQRQSGRRADKRVEERPRILRAKMPAQALASVHLKAHLMLRKRKQRASRNRHVSPTVFNHHKLLVRLYPHSSPLRSEERRVGTAFT